MWLEQPAFLLHRRPYRETSLLVSFLTPDQGRVDAVIKGVRGSGRKSQQKQAWLQPFVPLSLRWREQRQDSLITLHQFEAQQPVYALQGEALLCGLYMNELAMRLIPVRFSCEILFERYGAILIALAESTLRQEMSWLLRQYELVLLETIGAGLHLQEDAQGRPIEADTTYRWVPEHGMVPALQGISGTCLLKLAQGGFDAACLSSWKTLLRRALQPYLGNKPLNTTQLLRKTP